MMQFEKPTNLNGAQLIDELKQGDVMVNGHPLVDGLDQLFLDIKQSDAAKATAIVAAHDGNTTAAPSTVADKLASVGLSIEDLRAALA